mmetsp:Transcript_4379/g.13264  ORF Transcript_4379/g.13264 Transcript_4379/m.13264 type:complete len:335 (+) Transcript_4379:98-1102(+)
MVEALFVPCGGLGWRRARGGGGRSACAVAMSWDGLLLGVGARLLSPFVDVPSRVQMRESLEVGERDVRSRATRGLSFAVRQKKGEIPPIQIEELVEPERTGSLITRKNILTTVTSTIVVYYVGQRLFSYRKSAVEEPDAETDEIDVITLQLAFEDDAKDEVRFRLQKIAKRADVGSRAGLLNVMRKSCGALSLRCRWADRGNCAIKRVSGSVEAKKAFEEATVSVREIWVEDATRKVDNEVHVDKRVDYFGASSVSGFAVVVLVAAVSGDVLAKFNTNSIPDVLKALQTVRLPQLYGIEAMWHPEAPDEAMTIDELEHKFSKLVKTDDVCEEVG